MEEEMEITILNVYEHESQLRVEVEHDYGKDNIGLSIDAKYLDPETGEPRWQSEVKELLEKKYGSRDKDKKVVKTEVFTEHKGNKFKIGGKKK